MLDYVDLKYQPTENDLVCEFRFEPNKDIETKNGWKKFEEKLGRKISLFEFCAQNITLESSIGTWTDLSTMKDSVRKLKPNVFSINEKEKIIKVAYPLELFELSNIPQLLSSIAGNIYGMKLLKFLRLEDISFPKKYVKSFKGPRYGIAGVRKVLRIQERPLVGTIVKPKIGLSSKEHAKVAYDAWSGGLDFVKDDENLTSQNFNKFERRIKEVIKLKNKAENETGEKKGYGANITAPYEEMKKRLKLLEDYGNEYAMIDIITLGFSAVQSIIDYANGKFIFHGHRAMHGALTHFHKEGMSMSVLAQLARLSGLDQLHIGTVVGKMEGNKEEELLLLHEINNDEIKENDKIHSLHQEWYNIKPVFAVASGGLHPGHIPSLLKIFGKNIIIQAGGGVHGHPNGTKEGATALRQSLDAVMKGISLKEYAIAHKELNLALQKWGK